MLWYASSLEILWGIWLDRTKKLSDLWGFWKSKEEIWELVYLMLPLGIWSIYHFVTMTLVLFVLLDWSPFCS